MARKIIHVDLDAFFCAVEELSDPSLGGRVFAVGGKAEERGVISSCSYAARQLGVRSAMPTARAQAICPTLIVISPDHRKYSEASRQVMAHFHRWSGLVEQISIDEAFLDVTDLPEPIAEIARRLQAEILGEEHLPCSIGCASNKLVAKIATDVGKSHHRGNSSPCAICVVPPGKEAEFLAPLDVRAMWGVGPKTGVRFAELGILTIGDLAARGEAELTRLMGKMGKELYDRSRGIDERPVMAIASEARSISQEVTFPKDQVDAQILREVLENLAEKVGSQIRRQGLAGGCVRLKIRWSDFTTITRQTTLAQPTDQGQVIFQTVLELFEKNWEPGVPVRLIGVGITKIGPMVQQLELWGAAAEKQRRLQQAIDSIEKRFGNKIISRGRKKA